MRVLALETSSLTGSVALLERNRTIAEAPLPQGQRTAQSLAPAVVRVLSRVSWKAGDVDLVAVTQGPGSFTGLRIGITTAKVLAYLTGADLIGINTLAAIAARAPEQTNSVLAVLDAHRQQVYLAEFSRDDQTELTEIRSTTICADGQWIRELEPGVVVTGPGLSKCFDQIPPGVRVLDESLWHPQASTVGQLAYQEHLRGRRDDIWQFVPRYYRPSAAEEKLIRHSRE